MNVVSFNGVVGSVKGGSGRTWMSIGVRKAWKDQNGEWQEKMNWVPTVSFRKLGDYASTLQKGDLVEVIGEMSSWERDDGSNELQVVANSIVRTKKSGSGNQQPAAPVPQEEEYDGGIPDGF